MTTSLSGMKALVKGLAGPTSALFQASTLITIALNAVFMGLIPTVYQTIASLVTIGGVLITIFYK